MAKFNVGRNTTILERALRANGFSEWKHTKIYEKQQKSEEKHSKPILRIQTHYTEI